MRKYTGILVLLMILVLFIGPVMMTQVTQPEGRRFRGVVLEDTQHTEINFQNAAQHIELGGMLFVPSGEGPFWRSSLFTVLVPAGEIVVGT